MAGLAGTLDVVRIEEQVFVALVELFVVGDGSDHRLVAVDLLAAERLLAQLLLAERLPPGRLVERPIGVRFRAAPVRP